MAAKVQSIKVFKATIFATLCSESLLIGSNAFDPDRGFWHIKNTPIIAFKYLLQITNQSIEEIYGFEFPTQTFFNCLEYQRK